MVMSSSEGCEAWYWRYLTKGFLFMVAAGLQQSSKPPEVSGAGNTGLDNGQLVRSRRRDRGRGKRRQSDVMASYGHGTEKDGVQRSEEIDRDGENNEKSLGYPPPRLGIATRRT
jgi:hypothetical protein